jgi:hypothetical protein
VRNHNEKILLNDLTVKGKIFFSPHVTEGLLFSLSTEVKWCQFRGKDLLISIRSVELKGGN